jgi:hypothetical protein
MRHGVVEILVTVGTDTALVCSRCANGEDEAVEKARSINSFETSRSRRRLRRQTYWTRTPRPRGLATSAVADSSAARSGADGQLRAISATQLSAPESRLATADEALELVIKCLQHVFSPLIASGPVHDRPGNSSSLVSRHLVPTVPVNGKSQDDLLVLRDHEVGLLLSLEPLGHWQPIDSYRTPSRASRPEVKLCAFSSRPSVAG